MSILHIEKSNAISGRGESYEPQRIGPPRVTSVGVRIPSFTRFAL